MSFAPPRTIVSTLLLAGALLGGCEEAKDSSDGSGTGPKRSPDRGANANSRAALNELFKDEIEFTISELTGGKTNCDDIIHREDLAGEILPWPADLQTFLVDQLEEMPITRQVLDSVFAIYLVEEQALTSLTGGPAAAGLACDRGTDYKGVIFLNADTFVNDRRSRGIGEWQDVHSVQAHYITLDSGDNAAMTLVHEVLHAIDNKLYVNGLDAAARAGRDAVFNLSWTGHATPKFTPITLMSLRGDDTTAVDGQLLRSGCGTRLRGAPRVPQEESFALQSGKGASAEMLAKDLRYLADKTNFIVPYAMVTAAEDFAESLTIYYFGAYQDVWQTRTVYSREVADGKSDVLFEHRTKDILRKSRTQRDKLCQMAELVFASCELRSGTPD